MEEWRGMPVVKAMAQDIKKDVDCLNESGVVPTLAVIRVGAREDDLSYERGLLKRFDAVGARVVSKVLNDDVTQEELENVIRECNDDDSIHGILVFRPLPKHIDEKAITELCVPDKDVDCMGLINKAHTFAQDGQGHEPCTARAVMEMLDYYGYDLTGKNVAVIGRSMVVGKPLSMMLQKKNATVTMCHTKTKNIEDICKAADVICACAGVAKMVGKEYVSTNQVVIDVGINMVDGKLCGDVDYDAMSETLAATPVPGGVGTVTTSVLLKHTVDSAKKYAKK
ncbi:MAG: bifunctional 5,10-methylenetetrahydrofolate dehydrogenase/5,10-methenyltetrahydrofolate cyclohydrolase [Lachnospiraceae bacterium]|nr:bifunctional 5,10-methylenetetrahydrofolate dehydrogenase/5,10-methenyltetrahydrofolate cyclohydrolase [Candidatus Colinaster equi]